MEIDGEGRKPLGIRDAFHKMIVKPALCLLGVTCGRVYDVVEKTLSESEVGAISPAILGPQSTNIWYFYNFKLLKYCAFQVVLRVTSF